MLFKQLFNKWKFLGALALVMVTACADQEFQKVEFSASVDTLGARTLPAKVDIVVVPDNSGSISTAFSTVESQLTNFISGLKAQGWDYHVANIHMINPGSIDRVLVNPDYNSATFPDGTPNPNLDLVPASDAVASVDQFLPLIGSIDSSTGSRDDTYFNTYAKIAEATKGHPLESPSIANKNFFRTDALLAVVVITNGAEYSVDPGHNGVLDTNQLGDWADAFKTLRNSDLLLRFYPVSAAAYKSGSGSNYCLVPGGPAYIGTSYSQILNGFGIKGLATDFCDSGALSQVMSNISSDLTNIKQDFVHSFIVLDEEPIPGSIEIKKNGSTIPRDESKVNGWSFDGFGTTHTVTGIVDPVSGTIIPFQANQKTGWIIGLHGDAVIIGSDDVDITFEKP